MQPAALQRGVPDRRSGLYHALTTVHFSKPHLSPISALFFSSLYHLKHHMLTIATLLSLISAVSKPYTTTEATALIGAINPQVKQIHVNSYYLKRPRECRSSLANTRERGGSPLSLRARSACRSSTAGVGSCRRTCGRSGPSPTSKRRGAG
jgi:hypothetical protein